MWHTERRWALALAAALALGGELEGVALFSIEVFDPATGTFSPARALASPRRDLASAVLQDGRVLIAGGANDTGVLATLELVDASSGTVSVAGTLFAARAGASATPLAQQWIFNVATRGLSTNMTYVYRITLNDGSSIDYRYGLK